MRVVILQPGYFPWLGFFDQFHRSDVFVFYDDVQFDRRGWRHRNRIKGPDGVQWLTVPVLKKGLYTQTVRDARIDDTQPWQRKHTGSIRACYARAPHFERYYPDLEALIEQPWTFLVDLDTAIVRLILGWLGVERAARFSSELGVAGRSTERLCDICAVLGATEYLTGDAAKDYLNEEVFRARGIAVQYHNYHHPTYRQLFGPFTSHLSTIDLLFNHGPESLAILTGWASLAIPDAPAPGSIVV